MWKAQVGASLHPKWPIGLEATGNDRVSKLMKEQSGSIGYVEFIYALQNHLSYGRVLNRHGKFVAASLESIAAAASHLKLVTASTSPSSTLREKVLIQPVLPHGLLFQCMDWKTQSEMHFSVFWIGCWVPGNGKPQHWDIYRFQRKLSARKQLPSPDSIEK